MMTSWVRPLMSRQSSRTVTYLSLAAAGMIALFGSGKIAAETPAVLKVGQLPVSKVLFLGNSITLHGPKPDIGWTGNWGMAASVPEKDYVHLVTAGLAKQARGEPAIKVTNIANFERNFATYVVDEGLKQELAFQAPIVIVAIGENVPALSTPELQEQYRTAFERLLISIKKAGEPAIFVRGLFWPDATKDKIMKSVCEEIGGTFIDLAGAGADPKNAASAERKIEHAGVAAHPGDRGMQVIADAILAAISKKAGG